MLWEVFYNEKIMILNDFIKENKNKETYRYELR